MPKVLLVEDDNNLREIFEMRIQAEGYQTCTASNGEEGIAVALREKPDLIIADVMMPVLSGFDMIENLRQTPEMKNTKVIMMTALGQAEDQARGKKLGVVKYLVKSQATLEDFARVVKDILPPDNAQGGQSATSSNASSKNNQEGEKKMQEDNTVQNNPAGDSSAPAPADAPATPPTNPVAGDAGATSDNGGQMSTDQEQSAVNDQVNSFVNDSPATPADPVTPAADTPTTFAPTTPPADGTPAAPAADGAPAEGDDSGTSTEAPSVPPATPPADTPPSTPPQTENQG